MPKRVLLAQLSDLHVCDEWEGVDPSIRVERVVAAIRALPDSVDAALVTGDLSDDGSEESYRRVRRLLEPLEVPVHVLPGNHDDRARLRAAFDLPGSGAEPINYSVDVSDLRVVVFDSIVPGRDPGAYGPEQLRWLDEELGRGSARPSLLALHHPPLPTGLPGWDAINLTVADREAMAAVVARHPQLQAIASGHLHRVAAGALAGCPVFSAPSACLQARPDFGGNDVEFVDPPGFALHVYFDGELSSQAQLLGPQDLGWSGLAG
ncbi:MAG TPA: phosphodiesterase [Solirubrobacterales bacterium]|nr:phosphodiesterase [Solirubrobacterales bacterium]